MKAWNSSADEALPAFDDAWNPCNPWFVDP